MKLSGYELNAEQSSSKEKNKQYCGNKQHGENHVAMN